MAFLLVVGAAGGSARRGHGPDVGKPPTADRDRRYA